MTAADKEPAHNYKSKQDICGLWLGIYLWNHHGLADGTHRSGGTERTDDHVWRLRRRAFTMAVLVK